MERPTTTEHDAAEASASAVDEPADSAPGPGPRRPHRDRHGRGMRGPGVLPRQPGSPTRPTARARFDADVVAAVRLLEERWGEHLPLVEYAVEDAPLVPDDWGDDEVPLSSLVRGQGAVPHRVVIFRRPVERRSPSRSHQRHLVLTLVVEHLSDLLDLPVEEVDPRSH